MDGKWKGERVGSGMEINVTKKWWGYFLHIVKIIVSNSKKSHISALLQ